MATFIVLVNWTEQGIRDYKDTISRTKAVSDAAERLGGRIRDTFWTVGPYDVVGIGDFPDDETATAFLLWLGSLGNVRTTTLRAFTAEEMAAIISKAG